MEAERELDRVLTLLRNKIRERGFTQLEVQEALSWGRSYISQLLTKQKSLRVEQVLLILEVIGVKPGEFFGELYHFPQGEAPRRGGEVYPTHGMSGYGSSMIHEVTGEIEGRRVRSLLRRASISPTRPGTAAGRQEPDQRRRADRRGKGDRCRADDRCPGYRRRRWSGTVAIATGVLSPWAETAPTWPRADPRPAVSDPGGAPAILRIAESLPATGGGADARSGEQKGHLPTSRSLPERSGTLWAIDS